MNLSISKKINTLALALIMLAASQVHAFSPRRDSAIAAIGGTMLAINTLVACYQNGTSVPTELKKSYAALTAKAAQLVGRSKDTTKPISTLSASDKRSLAIATGTLAILAALSIKDWPRAAQKKGAGPQPDSIVFPAAANAAARLATLAAKSNERHSVSPTIKITAERLAALKAWNDQRYDQAYARRQAIQARVHASPKTLPLIDDEHGAIESGDQMQIQRAGDQVLPIFFDGFNFAPALAQKTITIIQIIDCAAQSSHVPTEQGQAQLQEAADLLQALRLCAPAGDTWLKLAASAPSAKTKLSHLIEAAQAVDAATQCGLKLLDNNIDRLHGQLSHGTMVNAEYRCSEELFDTIQKLEADFREIKAVPYENLGPQTTPFDEAPADILALQIDDASLFDNLVRAKITYINHLRKIVSRIAATREASVDEHDDSCPPATPEASEA
jgi:hypothetical protein